MTTSFVAIAGLDTAEATPRLRAAMAWAPQAGEQTFTHSAPCGTTHVAARASMPQLQRGEPWAVAAGRATVVDGWAVLRSARGCGLASAGDLAAVVDPTRPEAALDRVDGQVALVDVQPFAMLAANGFLGVPQLYWSELPGAGGGSALVVGNRLWMVAAALHAAADAARPSLPALDPMMLGWLLSKSRVPFGDETVVPGVRILGVDEVLRWSRGRLDVVRRPPPQPDATPFDGAREAAGLVERLRALASSGARFRIALTGGKDSRLVFAAALTAGMRDQLDHAYLKAEAGSADVLVGRDLAERHGVPFRLEASPLATMGLDAIDRHLALTGAMLGGWDLKAHSRVPRLVGLHGGFGEIYKSHAQPFSRLGTPLPWGPTSPPSSALRRIGWALARRHYQAPDWLDPYGLLRPAVVARIAATYATWLDRVEAEGQGVDDLHDRWHRECRMRRWLGQSLQAGAALAPMVNPLAGHRHLASYLGLPLRDRVRHRWHFETLRCLDDDLLRAGFAGDRWARALRHKAGGRFGEPVRGHGGRAPQVAYFRRHAPAIESEIFASSDDGFADVVDLAAARRLVERARAGGVHRDVEMALAMWTMRRALRGGWGPVQVGWLDDGAAAGAPPGDGSREW